LSGTAFGLEMKRRFRQRRDQQGSYYIGIGLLASSTRETASAEG
jgi:hypothetical protein